MNEAIKWGNPVYFTDQNLFYISTDKIMGNSGFIHGLDFDDSENVIEGTGTRMRQVKFRFIIELNEERVIEWIRQLLELVEKD